MPKLNFTQLFTNKIRGSGIPLAIAKTCHLSIKKPAQVAALQGHYREDVALFIPYFDTDGKPTRYHRVRYLGGGFSGRKFDAPKGHPPQAYFPPVLDWKKIKADPNEPIVITEGELKAIAAAKNKLTCVGLGGVWAWKSKALGMTFMPALEDFEWSGRTVELCFDSDISVKSQVRGALLALSRELAHRGAECQMVLLEDDDDGEKQGLDDYFLNNSLADFKALQRHPIQQDEASKLAIFADWVYVKSEDHVVDFADPEPVVYTSRTHFKNATQHLKVLNSKDKPVPACEAWYDDPQRMIVARRVFDPTTTERITEVGRHRTNCLNMYQGLDVEPRRGDVAPMLQVIEAIVDGRRDLKKWLLQWLAYPLQNPGAKLNQCVFVYSPIQGVGKTAIGEVMLDIYGRQTHGKFIEERNFFGDWNDWLEVGLFALCDELSFEGDKKSRSTFKRLITSESAQLSAKFRSGQHIVNRCNFWFTSNSPGGLPLESSSKNRRVLVLEVKRELGEKFFTTTFNKWRREDNGPSHWLYYLLNSVDCSSFASQGDAPQTTEVEAAVEATGTNIELWLKNESAVGGLFHGKPVWSSNQVFELYAAYNEQHGGKRAGPPAVSRGMATIRWARLGQHRITEGAKSEVLWFTPTASTPVKRLKGKRLVEYWLLSHKPGGLDKANRLLRK